MIFYEPRELELCVGARVIEWSDGKKYSSTIEIVKWGGTFPIITVLETYTDRGFAYASTDDHLTQSQINNVETFKQLLCSGLDRIVPYDIS